MHALRGARDRSNAFHFRLARVVIVSRALASSSSSSPVRRIARVRRHRPPGRPDDATTRDARRRRRARPVERAWGNSHDVTRASSSRSRAMTTNATTTTMT
jgi:hypothetical protein|tara:strand:- start:3343 stop:3645 length:303 start_codon:yes stop_codon:yes gene_type:complete